jgi:hypothetical protein
MRVVRSPVLRASEATFLDLVHSVANLLGLGGSQHVVGIDHAFGFNEHAVMLLRKRNEVPYPKFKGFADLAWITTWRRCPTRPIGSRVGADVLFAMLSDYLTVR